VHLHLKQDTAKRLISSQKTMMARD
jgi:hypothetical protein